MGLRKLTADLSNFTQGPSINTSDYPYHTGYEGGGNSYGDSKSIFDTKLFQQRTFGYGAEISTPLITRNFTSNNDRPLPGVEDNDTWKIEIGGDSGLDIFTEGFIRGGLKTSTMRALTDFNRLRKFFISPKGANFLLKQVMLQRMNPKIQEESVQLLGRDINFLGNTSRVFNPVHLIPGVNNLNEAAMVQHTGIFLNRAGLSPESYGLESGYNYDENNESKYEYIVRSEDKSQPSENGYLNFKDFSNGNEEEIKNRLLQLYQLKTYKHKSFTGVDEDNVDVAEFLGDLAENVYTFFGASPEKAENVGNTVESSVNTFLDILGFGSYPKNGISSDPGFLITYGGGPASTDGFGNTKIKRYKQDNKGNYIKINIGAYKPYTRPDSIDKMSDFRQQKDRAIKSIDSNEVTNFDNTPKHTDYKTKNIYSRINVGNVGQLDRKKADYNTVNDVTTDTLNALDVQDVTNGVFNLKKYRDLIRFRVEAVNSDDPNKSEAMIFRAFLENWSDSFNSNWNQYLYNGRGEHFYTYGSFNRNISFNFKIAATTRAEMRPIYRKLNFLLSNLAPDYSGDGNLRMRSPFMRLTIGSHINRIPGFFTNVNLNWNTNYPYEIALEGTSTGKDKDMLVLPHVLDINCQYQPIHNFLPQKGINAPFILPHPDDGALGTDKKWYSGGAVTSGGTLENYGGQGNIINNLVTGASSVFTVD